MEITETLEQRMNRATRCKTCGMAILPVVKHYKRVQGKKDNIREYLSKVYCDQTCQKIYKQSPDEFGLWWKT